jgi:hypothetical protein
MSVCGTTQRIGRVATVAALAAALLVAVAAPALAHGRGAEATNYVSRVTDAPDLPGVTWTVYGGDELLEVANDSEVEVLVYGYDGEPYLRVGPDGVFENRRSPAAYLNQDQYGVVEVPPEADPSASPEWEQVSGGSSHAWHDHRIHYMSPNLHPAVAAEPDAEQVVPGFERWEVPFRHGEDEQVVAGELRWMPGPSPWPWVAAAVPLVLPALAGLPTKPRAQPEGTWRWPGLVRPAAAVLAVVVALNLTRLADDLFAVPQPLTVAVFAAGQTALFLGIAAFGALRAWQAGDGAFTALGVGAGALLVGQGLLALHALSASQLATLLPDAVARLVIALSLVQALTVGAVAVIGTRRLLPSPAEAEGKRRPRAARPR